MQMDIVEEALRHYLHHWEWFRNLKNATDNERELAETKIALIKQAIKTLPQTPA
jgi:predicted metallo-beta-lactamase superfamily hydrolase